MSKAIIEIIIDQNGSVRVTGFGSEGEARQVADKLGITDYERMLHADTMSEGNVNQVVSRARILGYKVSLPQGGMGWGDPETAGPRTDRRWGLGRISMLTLGVALLVFIGILARDHMGRDYTPVPSILEANRLASESPVESGSWVTSLINPPDAPYVSFVLGDWSRIAGPTAITEGHYVLLSGTRARSFSRLIGPRNSSLLVFKVNTWESEPGRLQVDAILRDGVDTGESGAILELYPLPISPAPSDHAADTEIVHDEKKSFEELDRVVSFGRLERGDRGLRIVSESYTVVVQDAIDDALSRVIEDRVLGASSEEPGEPVTYYISLLEVFEWTNENGEPGRRQTDREIGLVRLDGISLGDLYIANPAS
jgi:hypothetical protein